MARAAAEEDGRRSGGEERSDAAQPCPVGPPARREDEVERPEPVAPFKEVIAEIKQAGGHTYRLCYQCGKCDVVCPWNRVRSFSMRRLIREASLGLTEIEGEDIWRCTTCGSCPSHCPRGVEQIELGVSLRRIATEYGVFPTSARSARTASGSLLADGNPLSEDRDRRADWAKGLPFVRPFEEGMELCYFVGCTTALDSRARGLARAFVRVLGAAGEGFRTLGTKEPCCGEIARILAKMNLDYIDASLL